MPAPVLICTLCDRQVPVQPHEPNGFAPDVAKRTLMKMCRANGCVSNPRYRRGWDGTETEPQPPPVTDPPRALHAVRWRATENDLVGGWCIIPEQGAPSPAEGAPIVADMLSRDLARHIVGLHNDTLPHPY